MSLEDFPERLKAAVGDRSINSFAKSCDLAESVIRSYLSGRSKPGLDKLYDIAKGAGIRVEWLATGEMPMRPPEGNTEMVNASPREEYLFVPRYEVQAAAGDGVIVRGEELVDYVAFKAEWVRSEMGLNPKSLALIQARGDSMLPTIEDGDLLLLDVSQVGGVDDAIYVLGIGDHLMVKRVQFLLDGTMTILSDNPRYKPQEVKPGDDSDLRLVGRVVWFGRRM